MFWNIIEILPPIFIRFLPNWFFALCVSGEDDTNASVRKKSELSQFELYLAKVKCRKKYDLNYREEKQESNQQILVIPSAEALQLIKVNKDNNLDKQPLENINE